jgi:uncharacterized protein YfaQ (DUF2300 family)
MFKDMVGDQAERALCSFWSSRTTPTCARAATSCSASTRTTSRSRPSTRWRRPCATIARQTTAAVVIAYNNEDTILRMLNSIAR